MIDFLLFCMVLAIFYGGFKAGNRYKSIKEMVDDLWNKVKVSL